MAVDLDLARKRFKLWQEADKNQIEREREDLAFYEGEGQWPSDIKALRAGQNANGSLPPVPARPCLTINKVKDPVRHVLNALAQADFTPELVPADDFEPITGPIKHEEIELREGLLRRIQRNSDASDARLWAASRAAIAGRGYYGIMTRYLPGRTMDQEIYYRRFYNQSSVGLDPAHEQPDGSDAKWAFVGQDMSWDTYQAAYGKIKGRKNELLNYSDSEFRGLNDDAPGWFTIKGKNRMVRVTDYFYTTYETEELVQLPDGSVVPRADVPEELAKAELPSRHRVNDVIHWAKIDGYQVLDETLWPGRYIPIIKVLGEEIQPFDKERRAEGIVRPSREAQQGYNYMATALVETIALVPKAPVIGYAGQFEGFEAQWDQANVRNIGRLEVNAKTQATGQEVLPIPQRQVAEPPIQAQAQALAMFDAGIKSTTGIPDPTLGNTDPSIRSGKALHTLLDQAQKGNSNYFDNMIRSAHHEARIVNDLLGKIYGRPGRLVRLITGHENTESVLVNQAFIKGENGMPVPLMDGQLPPDGQQARTLTLTKEAEWNVAIKVTQDAVTRREKIEAMLVDLISSDPQATLPFFADLLFKYSDLPQAKELESRGKFMLAPPVQDSLAGGEPVPPKMAAQMAQSQQQIQYLTQELQKLLFEKQAKEEEMAAKVAIEREDNASRERIAMIQASAQLAQTDAKLDAENARTFVEALEAKWSKMLDLHMTTLTQEHEKYLARLAEMHTAGDQGRSHAHEVIKQQQDHAHERSMQIAEHAHKETIEAMKPEPATT